jgi:hypothetical protein
MVQSIMIAGLRAMRAAARGGGGGGGMPRRGGHLCLAAFGRRRLLSWALAALLVVYLIASSLLLTAPARPPSAAAAADAAAKAAAALAQKGDDDAAFDWPRDAGAAPAAAPLLLLDFMRLARGAAARAEAAGVRPALSAAPPPLRVWLDERSLSAGETTLLKLLALESGAAAASGGAASGASAAGGLTIAGVTRPFGGPGAKATRHMGDWDVLWTTRTACTYAFPRMAPGQAANCVAGAGLALSKRGLARNLQAAYGAAAFGVAPRSWLLPQQYWAWRAHLAAIGAAAAP